MARILILFAALVALLGIQPSQARADVAIITAGTRAVSAQGDGFTGNPLEDQTDLPGPYNVTLDSIKADGQATVTLTSTIDESGAAVEVFQRIARRGGPFSSATMRTAAGTSITGNASQFDFTVNEPTLARLRVLFDGQLDALDFANAVVRLAQFRAPLVTNILLANWNSRTGGSPIPGVAFDESVELQPGVRYQFSFSTQLSGPSRNRSIASAEFDVSIDFSLTPVRPSDEGREVTECIEVTPGRIDLQSFGIGQNIFHREYYIRNLSTETLEGLRAVATSLCQRLERPCPPNLRMQWNDITGTWDPPPNGGITAIPQEAGRIPLQASRNNLVPQPTYRLYDGDRASARVIGDLPAGTTATITWSLLQNSTNRLFDVGQRFIATGRGCPDVPRQIAYWRFEDDFTDSGAGNDAIAQGATSLPAFTADVGISPIPGTGDINTASVDLDSTAGHYAEVPDSRSFAFGGQPITIEAWVKPMALQTPLVSDGFDLVVQRKGRGHLGDSQMDYMFLAQAGQRVRPEQRAPTRLCSNGSPQSTAIAFEFGDGALGDLQDQQRFTTVFSQLRFGAQDLNRWHHISVAFDGNQTFRFTLDGVPEEVNCPNPTFLPDSFDVARNLTIGGKAFFDGRMTQFLRSALDELRITPRYLPLEQLLVQSPSAIVSVQPNVLLQGDSAVEVTIIGAATQFIADETSVSLGDGIVVDSVRVTDGTTVVATVSVSSTATVGLRDVIVRSAQQSAYSPGGLEVRAASQPLYRARNGIPTQGESGNRVYMERNVALAATQLGVTDIDPDGDGWALVARTNGAGDDGPLARFFEVSGAPFAAVRHHRKGCLTLTPNSLAVVRPGQVRLFSQTRNTADCRGEQPSDDVDGDGTPDDVQPLYAVRDDGRRLYLDRVTVAAEAQLGVSDWDPDQDGFAQFSRTNGSGQYGTFIDLVVAPDGTPTVRVEHVRKGCQVLRPSRSASLPVAIGASSYLNVIQILGGSCP